MNIESDFVESWKNLPHTYKSYLYRKLNKGSFGEGTIFDGPFGSESRQPTIDEFQKMIIAINSTIVIEEFRAEKGDLGPLLWFKNLQEISIYNINYNSSVHLSKLFHLKKLKIEGEIQLEDLSIFTNLKELGIDCRGYVQDLEPLRNLDNLEKLNLNFSNSENPDSFDLTPLYNLINLTELSIDGIKFNDLSPLKNLSKLKILKINEVDGISSEMVCDLSFLRNLNLTLNQVWAISSDMYCDISFLNNLNLTVLVMSSLIPIDYSPISKMINLEKLYIYRRSEMNNLDFLIPLKKIKYLKLFNYGYIFKENSTGLNHLTELEYFSLEFDGVEIDLSFLNNNPKLEKLHLYNCNKAKNFLSTISKLHSLKELTLTNNDDTNNLIFLENLTNLNSLWLKDLNYLTSIKSISNLKNIKFLKLTNSPFINDISPIGEVTNLEELHISGLKNIIGAQVLMNLKQIKYIHTLNTTGSRNYTKTFYAKSFSSDAPKEIRLKSFVEDLTYLH